MSLTSALGGEDSRLSNVILGKWEARVVHGRIGGIIHLPARYQPALPRRRG